MTTNKKDRTDDPKCAKWIEEVLQAVADEYGVQVWQLVRMCKMREITAPRSVAMRIIRQKTRLSFPEIARAFRAHHSSVLLAIRTGAAHTDRATALAATVSDPPPELLLSPDGIRMRQVIAGRVEYELMVCPECCESQPRRVDSYGGYRCRECGHRWYPSMEASDGVCDTEAVVHSET